MRALERLTEYVMASLLLLAGVAGVVIGFVDFIGWDIAFLTPKSPVGLVLVTVGLLASALGLERIVWFSRYEQRLERLERLLTASAGGRHLIGHEETYHEINRVCDTTRNRIRALLYLTTPEFSAPLKWPETVARRLQKARNSGRPARLDAVIACNFQDLPSNFQEQVENRLRIYKEYRVDALISRYLLDVTQGLGIDIFIIDNEHAVIAFRSPAGTRMVSNAILFENQREIVSDFAEWFDYFVLRPAISYETWIAQHTSTP